MEVLLITQARLGSSRFPNKILKEINSKSLLEIHLNRLKKSKRVSNFLVASTFEDGIDSVKRISELNGFAFFQGSTKNVLDRFYQSSKKYDSDYIVRVTSDCPLIDAELIDQVINFTRRDTIEVFTKDSHAEQQISQDFLNQNLSNEFFNLATLHIPNPSSISGMQDLIEANIFFPIRILENLQKFENLKKVLLVFSHLKSL